MRYNNLRLALYIEKHNGAITRSRLSLSDRFTANVSHEELSLLERQLFSPPGTPFQQAILHALQQVPFGQTISYGKLAELAGYPRGGRAVGNACHRNPLPFLIPCHRVIQANGQIGGFALDLEIKRRLLEWEASQKGSPLDLIAASQI